MNHWTFSLVLLALGSAGCAAPASGLPDGVHPDPDQAGTEALALLEGLIEDSHAVDLGFDTTSQVAAAELGTPIELHYVHFGSLQAHDNTQPASSLLVDGEERVYPVLVNGEVRSSVSLTRQGANWAVASLGNPAYTTAFHELRAEHAAQSGRDLDSYSLVAIPSINQLYVAHTADDELMLTSVFDHTTFAVEAGATRTGGDLFASLSETAQTVAPALTEEN